jgi:hypothetical protein
MGNFSEIIADVKTFVRKIRRSSIALSKFKENQLFNGLPTNQLKIGIEIRWNSLYEMLNTFYLNKDAVNQMLGGNEENLTDMIDVSDDETDDETKSLSKPKEGFVI